MRLSHLTVALVLTTGGVAHADIIVPAQAACQGKKVGDACDGGVCASDGFECQAGICRSYGDEAACRANGCSWEEQISCRPAPAPAPAPSSTPTPSTPSSTPTPSPVPGGCAATSTADVGALLALAALAFGWRRRRSA